MVEEEQIEWADNFESRRSPRSVNRLEEIIWRGEERWASEVALEFDGETWTYKELAEQVRRLAGGISDRGLQPGDRAIIQVKRGPAWLILYFSLQALGVTAIPVPTESGEDTVSRARHLAAPEAAFVDCSLLEDYEWPNNFTGQLFEVCGPEQLLRKYAGSSASYKPPDLDSKQVASIFFTSGTTGEARGVCLTHENFIADLDGLYQLGAFGWKDRFLSLLPPYHAYGFTGDQLLPLYSGATIVYARRLASSVIMEQLREDEITILLAVPLFFQKMREGINQKLSRSGWLKKWLFKLGLRVAGKENLLGEIVRNNIIGRLMRKKYFPTLRFFVSGGAPLNPEIPRFFSVLGIEMLQGYGLTELSPVITVTPPGEKDYASAGQVLPGCGAGILNPDEDGLGEIVARGPVVYERYLENENSSGDLFRTGDIGYVEAGSLYVRGRKKNTIVTAEGKNIFPERVEEVYLQSDYIEELIVVAAPRSDGSGSQLKAIVLPAEENAARDLGNEVLEEGKMVELIGEELKKYGESLPDFQKVRDFELRWEPFPRTPTKKIKRYLFDHQVHSI